MSGKLVNKPAPPVEHEVCDEESIYRVNDGGMDLDKTNLPSTGWLPELAPLYRDNVNYKAIVCLRVKTTEAAAQNATSIKVAKNAFLSFLNVGMFLTDGKNVIGITALDTSNEDYDVITTTALAAAIPSGTVLAEAAGKADAAQKNTPNFMNFGWRNLAEEDTITYVGRVFGILESELYIPVTAADKASLGDRFMFI